MNQPIPRSFFKDGQRAVLLYGDEKHFGKIIMSYGCIDFVEYSSVGRELYKRRLLTEYETLYLKNDIELLDRTIDQVMEGDKISNGMSMRQVIGRVGDAVALSQIDGKVDWVQVSRLVDDKYEIVQPSTHEVMTEERARELREDSAKVNTFRPKEEQFVWQWNIAEKTAERIKFFTESLEDIIMSDNGIFFPHTEEGKKQCEEWGKKYAPAFIYLMNR